MWIDGQRFFRSLRYAVRGFQRAIAAENSFRIHVTVAVLLLAAMIALRLPTDEVAILVLLMSSILVLELVNTVVERFVGILEPRIHPYVGIIKDLTAAAVLIMSVAAIVIGVLILGPHVV